MPMVAIAFVLIFFGFLVINGIYSYQVKNIDPSMKETIKYLIYMTPLFFVANVLIAFGFKIGYKYFTNMTFVVSSSKLAEMLALLVVSYFFLSETPSLKTLLGIGIIVIGVLIAKP